MLSSLWRLPGLVTIAALLLTLCDPSSLLPLIRMAQQGVPGSESVDNFDAHYAAVSGNKQHSSQDAGVASSFYNLATEFYEYGWGDSFHFGWRKRGESHSQSIRNAQAHLATKLLVGNMDRVLDMGCGIGGPLRGVVRATGANVTGLTINAHQITRAEQITAKLTPYMQARCHFSLQDYLNVDASIEENAFDAAFYMESSLHCENRSKTFGEAYRLLRPGGRLVALEYVTLAPWNASDERHAELMRMHLHGNGAARTPTVEEALNMITAAGFRIVEHYDYMDLGKDLYGDEEFPWWGDLQLSEQGLVPTLLPAHPWVRKGLHYMLSGLSKIGVVPADVAKAAALMDMGGEGLSGLGKLRAITPQYYVAAVKPH